MIQFSEKFLLHSFLTSFSSDKRKTFKFFLLDMLNIFTLKKNDPAGGAAAAANANRPSAALLRVTSGENFFLRKFLIEIPVQIYLK